MFLLLLVGATVGFDTPAANAAAHEIVYTVDSVAAPTSNSAYAFLEREELMAGYIDGQTSPDALNPKVFHRFKKSVDGDVVTLSFNAISLSNSVGPNKTWKSDGLVCKASPRHGNDTSELLINCTRKFETVSVYAYAKGKGITGFFAKCFGEFSCWYQLRSGTGLLADWAH